MDAYLHTENLKLYRKVLDETNDEAKRKILLKLIRKELEEGRKQNN